MQNIPDAAELVNSVAEWLETSLSPGLSGADRYNARVAINVLRIVQRELLAGTMHHDVDRAALADFLIGPPVDDPDLISGLADRIRSGELDDRTDDLLPVLHAYAVRKLEVDNPNYLVAADQK